MPGCLFVVCPDVVGDWRATAKLWAMWESGIRRRGLPVALAAQDGLTPANVPWSWLDAVFIGGTTEWKMGPDALRLVREAQTRGKHVHFGRVNGLRRLQYANSHRVRHGGRLEVGAVARHLAPDGPRVPSHRAAATP